MTKDEWSGYCMANRGVCAERFVKMNEAFVRKIVIAKDYKMMNCIMPKCMSTITTMIYAYLTDPAAYKRFDWNNSRGIRVTNEDLKGWSMNVAIRDPLDRFTSAWVNKCIEERTELERDSILYGGGELCYGCGEDLECFLKEQYKRAMLYTKGGMTLLSYEDQHTFPQNWFCDFEHHLSDYNVIKHTSNRKGKEAFHKWFRIMLTARKVPQEKIDFIYKHILTPLNAKKTKLRDRRHEIVKQRAEDAKSRLLRDETLYNIFMAMFIHDYIIFDYEIPQKIS
ncbi:unnamed protein product [Bursaphelenchus xylophilus]|uniref:(pine wood nematode) hypothetical protein n=1 Tax=Bursaphelenchus xylophilus TaxID=6326 RepID=A0A1I7RP69_BURXY|nr:unnamed protein product [Bursaphelenchus xylophilus]CAG9124620.1 unnamed protein product [Bursaphelenchus xylophilus]